jgi:hypothetical protein
MSVSVESYGPSEDTARWVPLDEAALVAGVSVSSLRRWHRAGRIELRPAPGPRRRHVLVEFDSVLLERAAQVAVCEAGNEPNRLTLDPWQRAVVALCAAVETSREALTAARRRAEAADAEVAGLREQIRELGTWLEDGARFDRVEQLQLGRLLALSLAEREERRLPWLVSAPLVAAALYVVAVVCFAWFILESRL